MRARDKQTASEIVGCGRFIVDDSTQENLGRGGGGWVWQPPSPLVHPRVNVTVSNSKSHLKFKLLETYTFFFLQVVFSVNMNIPCQF